MKKYGYILIIFLFFLFLNTEAIAGYIERLQIGGENDGTSVEYFDEDYDNNENDEYYEPKYDIKYQYYIPYYTVPHYSVHYFPQATYRPYYPPMVPPPGMYPPPKPIGFHNNSFTPPPDGHSQIKPPSSPASSTIKPTSVQKNNSFGINPYSRM